MTNRQEVLFDARWRSADFEDPDWRRVALQYKPEELFALGKYVDGLDNVSLMCCKDCCSEVDTQTYTMTFDDSGAMKFLDMNRRFVRTKSGRPRLPIRPAMKNDDVF